MQISALSLSAPENDIADDAFEPKLELHHASTIKDTLEKFNIAVIAGPPGVGKTEMVRLSLDEELLVFDLRQRFLQDSDCKKFSYNQHKVDEFNWLWSQQETLTQELLCSPEQAILLDEFDLCYEEEGLVGPALETASVILTMAQRLVAAGKKVLLVLHDEALRSSPFMNRMRAAGVLQEDESVLFLDRYSQEEEQRLLKIAQITGKEAASYMGLACGLPVAYLPILRAVTNDAVAMPKDVQDLRVQAETQIKKNMAVIKKILPPSDLEYLSQLTRGQRLEECPETVLNSGLVIQDAAYGIYTPLLARAVFGSRSSRE
ncbi:MAG: hypothetical protein KDK78_06780 [Chlamydiia bacterium]|nr:hypothetical protein [Chlamydiia bacterium]